MIMKRLLIKLVLFAVPMLAAAQTTDMEFVRVGISGHNGLRPHRVTRATDKQGVKATLKYEQIADMATPRMGHQIFPTDGGLMVVGGHTTGNKLTETAEQYKDGSWTEMGVSYPHDGAFAVKLRSNRYLVGGGHSGNNGTGQSSDCSLYNPFSPSRLLRSWTLSVPRAKSKAICVGQKIYVSGNWNGNDNTLEYIEDGADGDFTPVGKTNGRSAPYLFASNDGQVMIMSAYDNYGKSFGFYTSDDGTELLVADRYNPATGQTSLIGTLFSPQSIPLALPDDVQTDNYHISLNGNNFYFILAIEGTKYALYAFDIDNLEVYSFSKFDIPTADDNGQAITWRGGAITNEGKEEVYLIGASGPATNQTLHIASLNYFTQEWTIASATGFKHNMLTASWTMLGDGRLACTGGGIKDDTDAQRSAYLITPPASGLGDEEPDDEEMVDRKFLVVETKDHIKTTYMLAEKPQVRFVGANLRVVSSKADVTYNLSDILRFTYETRSVTGVSELRHEPTTVDYTDGQLVVSGIKAGASVNVYSLEGKLVKQLTAEHAGTYRLSLSSLPQGTYIVKADNVSYKIMKR